jgi:TolB-like protein/DNA-binding winged helix-turn-helix (wHTH) protein/Tfp pilus assembly protein PilF
LRTLAVAFSKKHRPRYEFGEFRLDPSERLLSREGRTVSLAPKVFDTLIALIENSGRLLDKDELMSKLWPDTFVEEATLARNISDLRKALGESAGEQKFIETVPKRGYRFIAPVKQLNDEVVAVMVEKHSSSRIITNEEEQKSDGAEALQAVRSDVLRNSVEKNRVTRSKPNPILLVGFLLLIGLVVAAFYLWKSKTKETESPGRISRVAVLPFKPISSEKRDEHLELGMAETLITKLSTISRIVVRSTSSVRRYSGLEQDPIAAGRELKVESVLEGGIQRDGDKIRVTARLVRVDDGQSLWAETFDQRFTDIFAVQDSISEQVVKALALRLTGEERRLLGKRYTDNSEAYQLYLMGRFHWNKRNREGYKKAIGYFNQAIERDPTYALAYAGLADCYNVLSSYGVLSPDESFAKGKVAAARALELDDTLAEAHTAAAYISYQYERNFAGAETEFKRAIQLNPNYAHAHHWYALQLMGMGRFDEAVAEIRRAQEMEPLSLVINVGAGWIFYHARRYDQSIEEFRKVIDLDPNFARAYWAIEEPYEQKGMYEEALAALAKARQLSDSPTMLALLAHAYVGMGKRIEAQKILDQLKEMSKQTYVDSYFIAQIYTARGEQDRAFQELEKAYQDHSSWLVWLKVEPKFDSLRSDPRFTNLMARVGLSP